MNFSSYTSKLSFKFLMCLIACIVFFGVSQPVKADNQDSVCQDKPVGDRCSYTPPGSNYNPISGFCVRGRILRRIYCGRESDLQYCRQAGDVCTSEGGRGRCVRTGNFRNSRIRCVVSERPSDGGGGENDAGAGPGGGGAPDDTSGGGAPDDTSGGGAPDDTSGGNTDTGSSGGNGGGSPQPQPQSVQFDNPITATSVPELIATIIRGVLGLLGAVAVAIIVYAGFTYMTAGGNASKTAQATTAITNAVIGLVVIMGAFLIVDYVISAIVG
jgi:hypothetical protein